MSVSIKVMFIVIQMLDIAPGTAVSRITQEQDMRISVVRLSVRDRPARLPGPHQSAEPTVQSVPANTERQSQSLLHQHHQPVHHLSDTLAILAASHPRRGWQDESYKQPVTLIYEFWLEEGPSFFIIWMNVNRQKVRQYQDI